MPRPRSPSATRSVAWSAEREGFGAPFHQGRVGGPPKTGWGVRAEHPRKSCEPPNDVSRTSTRLRILLHALLKFLKLLLRRGDLFITCCEVLVLLTSGLIRGEPGELPTLGSTKAVVLGGLQRLVHEGLHMFRPTLVNVEGPPFGPPGIRLMRTEPTSSRQVAHPSWHMPSTKLRMLSRCYWCRLVSSCIVTA